MTKREQSRNEEIVNSLSHLFGVLFCLIAMPIILYKAFYKDNIIAFVSAIAYAIGMLLVYTFSILYHFAKAINIKNVLNKFDHISIFFLIAGNYTPIIVRYLDKETAIIFLSIMWSIVLIGIVYKIFFINRFKWLSLILYLTMGWMMIFVIKPLINNMPLYVFWWILAGGLSYTIGVYFYAKSNKYYYHSIWHLFVLCGTVCHFISVYQSITN